jgi:hypothetical protein
MRLLNRSVGASVVLLLGVAACGGDSTASHPSATDSATTTFASATRETATTSTPPVTISIVLGTTNETDRADVYLGATAEIYRRVLPNGQNFVVRLSTESYASVFGLSWTAPTGSAQSCLGDHAVFFGVPGDIGPWGSAWVAAPWFDDTNRKQPVVVQSSMLPAEDAAPTTRYVVVRTDTDASGVVLSAADGIELDRSIVTNGVAMVVLAEGEGRTVNDVRVAVLANDGQQSAPSSLAASAPSVPADCGPGDPPPHPLPAAGVQPADSDAAATQIRQRYALLVDRSVPDDQKPADLLDDDTGVRDAITKAGTGQFGEVVASATYSIDELVFTQPDLAWFRYTITTTNATYADRFGIAVFNGKVWQVTRATICQDLALALVPCEPAPLAVEAPSTPEWEAAWQEWMRRANLYMANDGCGPLSQC